MLNHSADVHSFDELVHRIHCAPAVSTELVLKLVDETQTDAARRVDAERLPVLHRLLEDGAWTDAALLLIEMELPQWKLRQLVLDDGQWRCSLSKQPNLPFELDETAECTHEVLPLAILGALVDALALMRVRSKPRLAAVVSLPLAACAIAASDNAGSFAVSCEDFR